MAFHFLHPLRNNRRLESQTPSSISYSMLVSMGNLCSGLAFLKKRMRYYPSLWFIPTQEYEMEQRKLKIIEKMEEKGMSVATAADAISFNPMILGLYLVKDAYPMPTRLLDKLEGALAN